MIFGVLNLQWELPGNIRSFSGGKTAKLLLIVLRRLMPVSFDMFDTFEVIPEDWLSCNI